MPRGFSMKPEPGDYLEYDGHTVKLCSEKGFIKKSWEATSGVPGSTPKDQGIEDYGPIPVGEYDFDPEEIDHFDWYNPVDWVNFGTGDWGNNRVLLTATPESKAEQVSKNIKRYGFFFHGGKILGTRGCIDLGQEEEDFFNTIRQYKGKLTLGVDYGL